MLLGRVGPVACMANVSRLKYPLPHSMEKQSVELFFYLLVNYIFYSDCSVNKHMEGLTLTQQLTTGSRQMLARGYSTQQGFSQAEEELWWELGGAGTEYGNSCKSKAS